MHSKLYLTDDPSLIILYSQLRQMTLQTLRGASRVTPKVEWAFILHSARLYDRMGCDILALDLGKLIEAKYPATWLEMLTIQSATGSSFYRTSLLIPSMTTLIREACHFDAEIL